MDILELNGKLLGTLNITWTISGDTLSVRSTPAGYEKVIPLSKVKSVTFASPPFGSISLNYGVENESILYKNRDKEKAEAIRDYINNYIASPPSSVGKNSFVDELVKLKSLLDAGVLSQEEFDRAKQKLLS